MTLHVGFTGTRHGMTIGQRWMVRELTVQAWSWDGLVSHHGDCVGADEEWHNVVLRHFVLPVTIEVHPGPHSQWSAGCIGDVTHDPQPHMKRNAAIVAASHVMIAAPYENEPQPRGGTWATIGMARRALKRGLLRELHVVGRDGVLLDHRPVLRAEGLAMGARMTVSWLAFTPAYSNARGSQTKRLGAHAFRDDAPRSLCGYVERRRAGDPAGDQARRCEWCKRVAAGRSRDLSESAPQQVFK